MKYLGLIVDDKDIATKEYVDSQDIATKEYVDSQDFATKEYVDSHTSRPAYKQTFTVTGSSTNWQYRIPYDADYSFEDLLNFVAYYYHTGEAPVTPAAARATFAVVKVGDYWSYRLTFGISNYYPASGDTIVVENMFTDQGTLIVDH